jgi:selenium-binding protein 1
MPVGKLGTGTGTGDGYGYDIAINPARNVILTSSFAGWNNYMRDLGEVVGDPAAMKQFGNTMVMWDLKAMKPSQVFDVPGAPLEIRWSLKPGDNWAITATALTVKAVADPAGCRGALAGEGGRHDRRSREDPAAGRHLDHRRRQGALGQYVHGRTTHYFDISNPEHPVQTYAKQTGKQVNMISQSWDGKRVYITSSLLSKWDKKGADDEQFLRAYNWDGKELTLAFETDFKAAKLGRPHHMKFTARPAGTALADL